MRVSNHFWILSKACFVTFVVVWMRMAIHRLIYLNALTTWSLDRKLFDNVRSFRRWGLVEGGVSLEVGFEVSKDVYNSLSIYLSQMHVDQNIKSQLCLAMSLLHHHGIWFSRLKNKDKISVCSEEKPEYVHCTIINMHNDMLKVIHAFLKERSLFQITFLKIGQKILLVLPYIQNEGRLYKVSIRKWGSMRKQELLGFLGLPH